MKTNLNKLALLSLATLTAVGCGPLQQDPTSDYKITKKTTENKQAKARTQHAADSGLAQIEVDDVLNFVEGESASYIVTPRVLLNGVKYSLAITGAPAGVTLSPVAAGNPSMGYKLSWSPKVGTVGTEDQIKVVDVVLSIVVSSDSEAKARAILSGFNKERTARLILQKTGKLPTVTQVKKESEEITEGESNLVTITVEDPGSFGSQVPTLIVQNPRSNNKDFTFVRGAQFVEQMTEAVAAGANKFTFKVKLNTANIVLPGTALAVDVKFVVSTISPSNLRSASEEVSVKVNRKIVAPPKVEEPKTETPKVEVPKGKV